MINIYIDCDNSAFQNDCAGEVARILRDLAQKIENRGLGEGITCFDANGNNVGMLQTTEGRR